MGMFAGIIIITLLFSFLLELRQKMGIYSINCLPACTSCIWVFIILPLGVGAPAAIVYLGNSSTDYSTLSTYIIGFVALLIMIGVSVGAIALNYIFKAIEIERKTKFVVRYMIHQLYLIAVKASEELLRQIYDQYLLNGENILNEALSKGEVVYWWPIPPKERDLFHNRILLDAEQIKNLKTLAETKKLSEIPVSKPEEKNEVKKKVKFCCQCCYDSDDEEEKSLEPNEEPVVPEAQIIREENKPKEVIDFRLLIDRIRNTNQEPETYVGGLYVQPYNAIAASNL